MIALARRARRGAFPVPILVASIAIVLASTILRGSPLLELAPAASQTNRPGGSPDFARMLQDQAATDQTWRAASEGHMRMEKITYRSKAGDLEIPAFVFQPLQLRGPHGHPAIVWVHENIRGHLYEHYIPYIREATARGYIVIAPEYRGGVGYGKAFYDAIDYGGAEVDDVVTAADVLSTRYPQVDPSRMAIIGWSHGGLITILAITRNPAAFKAAVAMVPVTNLFQRLAWKGVERQRAAMDPANRLGGVPAERHDVYKERSPLFQIDRLQIPLLVHVTRNDDDVNIEEDMALIDALRARKPFLAETKVYENPPGGHTFDRRVDPGTWQPENTREQRDSWNRVWTFFDWNLDPYLDNGTSVSNASRPEDQR
jgi:dipeptidyl aminopeptidase/acylaminoacyl peptidase